MRIEWSERAGDEALRQLVHVHEALSEALSQTDEIRRALERANPGGENKRLNALTRQFEAAATRLKDAGEDAGQLEGATRFMIRCFGDCECQVTGLLESLDIGRGSQMEGRYSGPVVYPTHARPIPRISPRKLPPCRVAPDMRISPMGPVPGWLRQLIAASIR